MPARFIPNDIRDQIRHAADIVDVVGSYIPLKQMGSAFKACCPFHQEKTPSFTVSSERQSFHCFGCGKGGDVYRFVMEYEGVDFTTAAHLLAQRYHIVIPERSTGNTPDESRAADQKDKLYAIHEQLTDFYQRYLREQPDSEVAQYLKTRELDSDSLAKFRIGAAPDAWDAALGFLRRQGFTDEEIQSSGVVSTSEKAEGRFYDRFRNRLVFPIWNEQGRVVGFSSRKVVESDGGGKYVNSPESPIFKKSRVLYAYALARRAIGLHREAILCEGQLDVIAMHRAGFENTVAPQGTAFTEEQARLIRRQTDRLAIALDSDAAGTEAVLRCIEIVLPLDFEVRVIRFPGGKDPDELFRNQGKEAIFTAVQEGRDFLDFLISYWGTKVDLESPSGRAAAGNAILKVLAKIANEIRLAAYVEQLSKGLGLPLEALRRELTPLRSGRGSEGVQEEPVFVPVQKEVLTPEMRRARLAEGVILPLVLSYETSAQTVANTVEPGLFSRTAVGEAIEAVIEATLNGDWIHRLDAVMAVMDRYPESGLSGVLVETALDYPENVREKATADAVLALRESALRAELSSVMQCWKNTLDAVEQERCRSRYQVLDKAIKSLKQTRTGGC